MAGREQARRRGKVNDEIKPVTIMLVVVLLLGNLMTVAASGVEYANESCHEVTHEGTVFGSGDSGIVAKGVPIPCTCYFEWVPILEEYQMRNLQNCGLWPGLVLVRVFQSLERFAEGHEI